MSDELQTTRDFERAAANAYVHLPKLIADEFGVSRSEARRLLATGAVKLDGTPCGLADLPASELARKTLTVGKRRRVEL